LRCFEPYAEDPQEYARSTSLVPSGCESELATLLRDVQSAAATGGGDRDARFNAAQNARSAAGAEAYYRSMMRGDEESWNVRDRHMTDTLDQLREHHGPGAKAIVWEHNTHIGDARFTDMADAGMVNVGQLVREAHADDGVVLVGFGGYEGRVVAAGYWGGPTRNMTLPAARTGSYEKLLHDALGEDRAALFIFDGDAPEWALQNRSHRAVGVVYQASAERWGNYVPTVLARRYDAFLWIDQTTALSPLHGVHVEGREREAWPSGY
jgi:erythromycin esterase-like protein